MNQPPSNENEFPSLNQTLIKAQKKAKSQIRTGVIVLVLSVIGAISAGGYANHILEQAQEAKQDIKLEQQGFTALNEFDNQQIKALLTAMEAGNKLKKRVKNGQPLEKYPATIPILALQTILDNIHERNQIQKYDDDLDDISFSSDGQQFVTVSKAGFAEVRDLSGKFLTELKDNDHIRGARFSPDGQHILTWSYYNVRIWNLAGKLLSKIKNNNRFSLIHKANFTLDGKHIIIQSPTSIQMSDLSGKLITQFDTKIIVNDVIFNPNTKVFLIRSMDSFFIHNLSGKLLPKTVDYKNKYDFINTIANISPDGQRIISIDKRQGTVYISDLSGKLLKEFKLKAQYCNISPLGQHFVCLLFEDDKGIGKIWDSTGNLVKKFELSRLGNVNFSLDGKYILISSSEYTFKPSSKRIIQVLDLSGKPTLPSIKVDSLYSLDHGVIVKPKQQLLITISGVSSKDKNSYTKTFSWKNVQIWDLSDKQLSKIDTNQQSIVTFSSNAKYIIFYDYSSKSYVVKDFSGNYLAKLTDNSAEIRSPTFSLDGKLILSTSNDEIIRVWNLGGKLLTKVKVDKSSTLNTSFSPDGQLIIINSFSDIKIWDLSGKLLKILKPQSAALLQNASFSPDGKHIFAIDSYSLAKNESTFIWDLSGKQLAQLTGKFLSFSPNGKQILVTNGSIASVYDLSGNLLVELAGHQGNITSANFSHNGKYIVTASNDKTARVWYLSGKLMAELKGHNQEVEEASFSPDGQRILTISNNFSSNGKNIYIWDLLGRQLAKFETSDKASFSPDGTQIFITSSKGVEVWRVGGLDDLLARGCDWLKDYLALHPEAQEKMKECQSERYHTYTEMVRKLYEPLYIPLERIIKTSPWAKKNQRRIGNKNFSPNY